MKELELHQPDEEVIEKLQHILERAKAGEILGFFLVGDIQGGSSCTYQAGPIHRPLAVGQLELLKFRILHEWMYDVEPIPEEDDEG